MGENAGAKMDLPDYLAAVRAAREPRLHLAVLRLTNTRPAAQALWLEPWGDRVEMTPGGSYDIVASGPAAEYEAATYERGPGHWFAVETLDDGLVVYAPTVTTGFAVFHEGRDLFMRP